MRPCETLRDDHGADGGCIVAHLDLRRERLVEGQRGGLARAVVDHCRRVDVRCLRGHRHDHPVVVLDHVGQKLAGQPVMRERVDFEGQTDIRLGRSEHCLPAQNTRVVNEHGRLAHLRADLGRYFSNLVGRRDVALEELDVGVRAVLERLDIEDGNFDAAQGQTHRDALPDPIAAARQQHELLAPVVRVARPIVERFAVEVVVEPPDEADGNEGLEGFEEAWAVVRDVAALGGVVGEEQEGEGERGREEGFFEDGADDVCCEA